MSVRPAWATQQAPGQPELWGKNLSQKINNKNKQNSLSLGAMFLTTEFLDSLCASLSASLYAPLPILTAPSLKLARETDERRQ